MAPTATTDAARMTPRIWPITAMLVIIAFVLMLMSTFIAGIEVAPFFGDHPSRDSYIEAGMTCVTTLPVFAAMVWCGQQRGSRHGLWLIGVPAGLMAYSGLNLLLTTGGPNHPHPNLAPDVTDLFSGSTVFNWIAFVVFAVVAVTTHLQRRRARRTQEVSAT
ncbi:MAG TPA: hypothetical protein VF317_00195 [Dermatophilaceae bacterium]